MFLKTDQLGQHEIMGGNRPGTKHLFAAKKAVDSALGRSGTSIYIPGAGPARRTV